MIDKVYCCSSYLMYRTIADHSMQFREGVTPHFFSRFKEPPDQIHDSYELENSLRKSVEKMCAEKKTAIALSGGIDSAILAKFMPKGSTAYTFKCVVPGMKVTDETIQAAKYAEVCGLKHEIIEIYWEDFEQYAPILMANKGAPCHSIEIQIYKAGLKALQDGHEAIIYGESSDIHYGGLSGLLSKNWTVGEFIDRYSYVKPYYALKEYRMITEPIERYVENGFVDVHEFNRHEFFIEAMGSYTNACETAGIEVECPYARTWLATPLDLDRIRSGENKYIVRELFNRLYPGFVAPPKTPMPRPVDQWFKDWAGPTRHEFWPNCIQSMNGDQRYYVWALEKFLDYCDSID